MLNYDIIESLEDNIKVKVLNENFILKINIENTAILEDLFEFFTGWTYLVDRDYYLYYVCSINNIEIFEKLFDEIEDENYLYKILKYCLHNSSEDFILHFIDKFENIIELDDEEYETFICNRKFNKLIIKYLDENKELTKKNITVLLSNKNYEILDLFEYETFIDVAKYIIDNKKYVIEYLIKYVMVHKKDFGLFNNIIKELPHKYDPLIWVYKYGNINCVMHYKKIYCNVFDKKYINIANKVLLNELKNIDELKEYIEKKEKKEELDNDPNLLIKSCEKFSINMIKTHLEYYKTIGKDIEEECLLFACKWNDIEMLKLLIQHGGKVYDEQAIDYAKKHKNVEMLKLLYDIGCYEL